MDFFSEGEAEEEGTEVCWVSFVEIECLGGVWYMFSNNNFQFLSAYTKHHLSTQVPHEF